MIIYWGVCLISIVITWLAQRITIKTRCLVIGGNRIRGKIISFFESHFFVKRKNKKIASFVINRNKNSNSNASWLAALICSSPLLLLSALRYRVGTDYASYEAVFPKFKNNLGTHEYEWLFTKINVLLNKMELDFQSLIILTSIIYSLLVFKMILEESPYPELSIFLLLGMTFYFQSFNVMRNMLACAICLYSIQFIKKRNIVMFGICVFFAFGFHLSAVVFLPLYFLPNKKLNLRTYSAILLGIVISFRAIGTLLSNYIVQLGSSLNNGYYLTYFTGFGEQRFGIVSFFINFCLFSWAYIFSDEDDRTSILLLNIQFLALLLSMLNGSFPLVNRIRFYYGLPSILLIPRIISSKNMKKHGNGFVVVNCIIIIAMFFCYCWYIEGVMNQSGCIPYQSILKNIEKVY